MKKRPDLLNDNVESLVLKYMIPSVAGMLGLSACIFFDTLFVGKGIGDNGLAALNIAVPIFNFYNSIGYLLGVGGATTMSIAIGRKQHKKAHSIFTVSIIFSLIIGLIFTLGGIFFINPIARFFGASEELLPLVTDYLSIILYASILFILSITLNVFVRNDKAPKLAMWAVILGNFSNIILDYILIFPLDLGMKGAAIATITAPTISIIVLSLHFIRSHNSIHINFTNLTFEHSPKIFKNGASSLVMELSAGLIIFTFNLSVFKLKGDLGIAAYSIIANLSMIVTAIYYGVSQAIQPIISINYGADNKKRVLKAFKFANKIALAIGVLCFLLGLIFPKQLTSIFTNDRGELLKLTITGIKLYFMTFIFSGLNIVAITYFQCTEKTRFSTTLSFLRGIILVMIGVFILPKFLGIDGIWLTIPISEILTLIVAIIFYIISKKKSK
ncbi:MATE family efflux transporter [Clostridium fallax]|uniref:Multidrug export protein MepA n=1 Tax=Clostridium fallax TaxID=1533 RepID=A0A1M4ST53_9CLOT|nr:MATE family efflux transporter [Clostridium fallax]SHE35322.1 putative efflux protein, MATE family [Clostridium fallax]SQB07956.1 MATE efflux family protein [Clostridium fallax]